VSRWAASRNTNPIKLNGPIYNFTATTVVCLRGPQRIPCPSQVLAQAKHDLSDPPANYVDAAAKLFHDATPILICHDGMSVARDRYSNVHLSRLDGDAVVQEPVQDKAFGKKKAVVAYMELENKLVDSETVDLLYRSNLSEIPIWVRVFLPLASWVRPWPSGST